MHLSVVTSVIDFLKSYLSDLSTVLILNGTYQGSEIKKDFLVESVERRR